MKNKKEKKQSSGIWLFLKMTFQNYLKEWKLASIILMLIILIAVLQLMIPLLTSQMTTSIMIKNGAASAEDNPFYWGIRWDILTYIAVGLALLNVFVSYLFNYISFILGIRIEVSLRNQTLETLVREDISYYSDKKIGEILTKVISDTQIFGNQAVNVPMQFGISFFQLLASLIMMFIFEWRLATINMIVFLVIFLAIFLSFAITTKRFNIFRAEVTKINGDVTDRIISIRLIKSTGTENYETDRFKEVHKTFFTKAKKVGNIEALMLTILFGGVAVLQFASIIATMIIYGSSNDPTAVRTFFQSTFAAFTLAQGLLINTLFSLMNSIFGLAQATVSAERIQATLDSKAILDPHYHDGVMVDSIKGDIKFEGVSFMYPEKPEKLILPKFDFEFKKGKSYAFVGETGSGKSTISKLLLRFYDPTTGKVTINNGLNLKDVNLRSYLDHIGYVEQEPQIMFGDVFENVKYGSFNATNEEVVEAAKKAELHDLIMTWPDGYNTILGERGFMLSGGQKQRLVIARMFLKDPQILILDEATSALDNIVEKEIQEKLESLMVGRTTISIAHRLSTIKNVDQIIVLGQGTGIVQIGTFEELKNTPGHFQNLYNAGLME